MLDKCDCCGNYLNQAKMHACDECQEAARKRKNRIKTMEGAMGQEDWNERD